MTYGKLLKFPIIILLFLAFNESQRSQLLNRVFWWISCFLLFNLFKPRLKSFLLGRVNRIGGRMKASKENYLQLTQPWRTCWCSLRLWSVSSNTLRLTNGTKRSSLLCGSSLAQESINTVRLACTPLHFLSRPVTCLALEWSAAQHVRESHVRQSYFCARRSSVQRTLNSIT